MWLAMLLCLGLFLSALGGWVSSYFITAAYEWPERPKPVWGSTQSAGTFHGPVEHRRHWFTVQQPGRLSLVRQDVSDLRKMEYLTYAHDAARIMSSFSSFMPPMTKVRDPAVSPEGWLERIGFAATDETLTSKAWHGSRTAAFEVRRFMIPYWFVSLLPLVPLLWAARRLWRGRRSVRWASEGRCGRCGYDLRATPGRCSECGWDGRESRSDPKLSLRHG